MRAFAIVSLFALSGCFGPDGASLSFSNSSPFGETSNISDTAECGSGGTLGWAVNVHAGGLTIQVLDGSGAVLEERSWLEASTASGSEKLSGRSGTWTLSAHHTNLAGTYDVELTC